jgi:hypothetical protein
MKLFDLLSWVKFKIIAIRKIHSARSLQQWKYKILRRYFQIAWQIPTKCLIGGFGGLVVRMLALVPEFVGSNPAEAVGFFCI